MGCLSLGAFIVQVVSVCGLGLRWLGLRVHGCRDMFSSDGVCLSEPEQCASTIENFLRPLQHTTTRRNLGFGDVGLAATLIV